MSPFSNPATGLVHVAIGEPGLVDSIDPRNGHTTRTVTGAGAHTTALVAPDQLYVIFTRARRNPRALGRLTSVAPTAKQENQNEMDHPRKGQG